MILLRNVHPRTKLMLNNQIVNLLKRQLFLGSPAFLPEDGDLSQQQMDGSKNNNNNSSNDIHNNNEIYNNNNMAPVSSRVQSKGLKQRKLDEMNLILTPELVQLSEAFARHGCEVRVTGKPYECGKELFLLFSCKNIYPRLISFCLYGIF